MGHLVVPLKTVWGNRKQQSRWCETMLHVWRAD